VQVVERGQPGREASWAGAGILPPAPTAPTSDPYEQLLRLSNELHLTWSAQLREQTGVDNGLRRCGGFYLARSASDGAELRRQAETWREQGIACHELDAAELDQYERLLEASDNDIFDWISGRSAIPPEDDTPVLRKLLAFRVRF